MWMSGRGRRDLLDWVRLVFECRCGEGEERERERITYLPLIKIKIPHYASSIRSPSNIGALDQIALWYTLSLYLPTSEMTIVQKKRKVIS